VRSLFLDAYLSADGQQAKEPLRGRNIFSWSLPGPTRSIALRDEVLRVLLCVHPKLKQLSQVALRLKSQPKINS